MMSGLVFQSQHKRPKYFKSLFFDGTGILKIEPPSSIPSSRVVQYSKEFRFKRLKIFKRIRLTAWLGKIDKWLVEKILMAMVIFCR